MDAFEMTYILRECPGFLGVFSQDRSFFYKLPGCLVANLDKTNQPGSHWVAIYVREDRTGVYFDPFGPDHPPKHLSNLLDNNLDVCEQNNYPIQGLLSNTCGYYAAMCLYCLSYGIEFQSFLNCFTDNSEFNDKLVQDVIKVSSVMVYVSNTTHVFTFSREYSYAHLLDTFPNADITHAKIKGGVVRFTSPVKFTGTFFLSGKATIIGLKDVRQANSIGEYLAKKLRIALVDVKLHNIVACYNLGRPVNLIKFMGAFKNFCNVDSFVNNSHPALHYKPFKNSKMDISIYGTGRTHATGLKNLKEIKLYVSAIEAATQFIQNAEPGAIPF